MGSFSDALPSVFGDYVIARRKQLPDGSIVLSGKRWGLVALVVLPPLFLFNAIARTLLVQALDSPGLRAVSMAMVAVVLLAIAFIIWTPRRIIVFDALLGRILVRHKGLLKERRSIEVSVDDIRGLRIETEIENTPAGRPVLFLQTVGRELYLASIGRLLMRANLVRELQSLVASWKKKRSKVA